MIIGAAEFVDRIQEQKRGQNIPPETCPLIDQVKEGIRDAMRQVPMRSRWNRHNNPDTLEEALDKLEAVESALDGLEDVLETIRKHNSTLRDLGIDWYQTALDIAVEADNLSA